MPKYSVVVIRKKSSYDFIIDKSFKPNANIRGFLNRKNHNFGDTVEIRKDNKVIYTGPCQSVANHPDAPDDGSWSLATGTFDLVLWEDPREFNCPVHGIGDGYDKLNHYISKLTFDINNSNKRMLFHDDQSRGPKNKGRLDSGAYSEGCIIQPMKQFAEFNNKLRSEGLKKGDRIMLSIIEVDE